MSVLCEQTSWAKQAHNEAAMLEDMKDVLRMLLADDELFELSAQLTKKGHEALLKAAFTEEQATKIVAWQGAGVKAS